VGDVRPSQVITTFGPGAVVDLQTLSILVAGIDGWPVDDADVIHEPRLERALGVDRFLTPRPSEGSFSNKRGTVPSYIFPRAQLCPVCRTLSILGDGLSKYVGQWSEIQCTAPGCKGRGKYRATTLPAPFVIACPTGHLDEFPWRTYVHRGATACNRRMTLISVAKTGSIADLLVQCECGTGRTASDAFGEDRAAALGVCTRRRPWLGGNNEDPAPCPRTGDVRAMQRGATNAWFPVVRSALRIGEAATPIGEAIAVCDPKQIEKINSIEKLRALIELEMFPSLAPFDPTDVWTALLKLRGELATDDVELRWPEWSALRDPDAAGTDRSELFLEKGAIPAGEDGRIARVVLGRKLLEVRALVGFTRIDAPSMLDGAPPPDLAPIYRDAPGWLPAIQVRGEGIFLELREEAVSTWETQPVVRKRADAMAAKFAQWQTERGGTPMPFPGARYVLLHGLAHAIIRQLSLECGYSASSVRERIYSSSDPERRMAGILLYTASPDSEGSLGGLVDLGTPKRFPQLLRNALASLVQCSSDPLCADHRPDVHATINAAACHACVLVSETSCESFNRFLDRNYVVPTMAESNAAFFPDPRLWRDE